MKAQDLKTIETFIAEYGMKPGVSTPVGNQTSGVSSTKLNTGTPATPAKKLDKGAQVINPDDGEDLEIVDKVGNQQNPDTLVAKNKKGEFTVIDPESEVEVKEELSSADRILKRKHKLKNKIKHVLRAQKQSHQGEPVFEINFNNAQVIKSALDAPVSCGFEAEVVFPSVSGGNGEFDYNDHSEDEIMDMVWDQHGTRTVNEIKDGFTNWMMDSSQFEELQLEIEEEMTAERMDDNSYIDTVLEDNFTDEEVEEYATEELEGSKQRLQRLKDSGGSESAIDTVEREVTLMADYNLTDWGRHMVTHEHEEMLREHIQEELRNYGESVDAAAQQFTETYSIQDWVEIEYGSWDRMLYDFDAWITPESDGGVEEVANMLTDWANSNSKSDEVEAGEYHQGAGNTEQDYWRVEEDSSIDTDNGAGAEIISPVYSTPREMLKEMKSLFEWLDDEGAETNSSTGLHVTMSLTDGAESPVNPLKMALLLGDKYLLKQFGREFNGYAKSQQEAVMKVARRLEKKDNLTAEEIQQIETILKRGINYDKFSSINFKDASNSNGGKLIEFRIGGGEDYHNKFETAAKSAIRYAVTMQAGHDPEAYKQDYIKTIVKLVDAAKDELTDAERANLEKGAGLDLKQSVFLDLIKQYSSRDNYYDNLDLYNLATQGETHAAVKLLNMFFMQAHAGKIDINTRTKRAILTAFKEMEIKPSEYFDALEKQMADVPNKANVVKTYDEIADGFNKLTGKTAPEYSGTHVLAPASAPEYSGTPVLAPAFTVKFNPETQRLFMPGPIADAVSTASGNNTFGGDDDVGQLPAQFTPKMFIAIDNSEYNTVRAERWDFETALEQHNQQLEIIQSLKDSIKQNPERADQYKEAMAHRLAGVEQLKKQMEPSQKAMDAFKSKYGFVPLSARTRSETISNEWKLVSLDELSWLSSNHNIQFTATESVFAKFDSLPLQEQLRILSKVDKRKLDEAWSKKKKIIETIEAGQDMAALLTAYGTPKKKKKKSNESAEQVTEVKVKNAEAAHDLEKEIKSLEARIAKLTPISRKASAEGDDAGMKLLSAKKRLKNKKEKLAVLMKEGAVPDHSTKRDYAEIMSKPLLGSDIHAQMNAYFIVPDPSMIREFRSQISMGGKGVDLRPTFKAFAQQQLHPKEQAQIAESKLNEYDDLNVEKQNLIQTISGLDATNEKEAQLLDRIYKLLNSERISTTIGTAFNRPLADETMSDAEKAQIMQDMTKIIGGLDSDYASVNRFVTQLETAGSAVNIAELAKPLNSFANVFSDPIAIDAMTALATYGVGKKQKGPGEYALAILSEKIRLANGEGDLEVDGIGKVELKAALTTAGGRIGYGGGSQKAKRAVIDKYAQYIPTVINSIGGTGGSLGLSKFIPALNADLPVSDVNNQKIRRAIATELLQMDLEKFAGPVVEAIATKEDLVAIEDAYLRQNFEWYKDRDDFDALLLMHIPNRKTAMIKNADDLIKFRRSGHSNATSISVIPTQAGAGREQWAQLTLNKGTV